MITPISEVLEAAPQYFQRYIKHCEGKNLLEMLDAQKESVTEFFWDIPADRLLYRYDEGKWSVKEIFGHLIDTERILSYRLLRFSRNDSTPLPGFEEDDFVANADFDAIPEEQLLAEWIAVRESSLLQLRNLPAEAWKRGGLANGQYINVEALACILAGHVEHHFQVIRERYLA